MSTPASEGSTAASEGSSPPPSSDESDRSKETTPAGVERELERLAEAEGATQVPHAAETAELPPA